MKTTRIFVAACIVLAATASVELAACSGAETPGRFDTDANTDGPSSDAPTIDAAEDAAIDAAKPDPCSAYAGAYCGRLQNCAPGFFFPGQFLDVAACEATYARKCRLERAAPGVSVGIDALGPCVSAIEASSCSDVLSRKVPAACGTVGTLAEGAACGIDMQCTTGFCAKTSSGCGMCARAPAAGEPCVNGRCGALATCGGGFGPDRRCVPIVDLGGTCGPDAYCRFGLDCVSGKCSPGLKEGAPCMAGETGNTARCDVLQGLQCNGFTENSTCRKPTYVDVGKGCGFNEEETDAGLMFQPTACRADGFCPQNTPEATTCLRRALEGEACEPNTPDSCATELVCRKERCVFDEPSLCH